MSKEEVQARHGIVAVIEPQDTSATEPSVSNGHTASVMRVDPLAALKAAEHALDLARVEARRCRAATLEARGTFSKALEAWNRSQPVATADQQARAFIATSQADRAARAAQGRLPYLPGITATAKAMAGGNAKRGGGSSYRRGAFTKAEAKTIEANKLRIAATNAAHARIKLPS